MKSANQSSATFLQGQTIMTEQVGDGITRQILGYNHELMLVKVWFKAGAEGYAHQHPHSQVSYVESGVFDVMIDGVVQRLVAGDCFMAAPGLMHGAVCIEDGVLIDTFSPARQDFLGSDK